MQKITPHLWFDTQAKEAGQFYTSVFKECFPDYDSQITDTTTLSDTPSGTVDMLTLQLLGQKFMFISAGPYFTLNPSVSFLVACTTKQEVDALWNHLSKQGSALMELNTYPFSEHYGWIQDKYGVSWQIMYMGDRPVTQKIIPTLMFVGEVYGKAEEAINFYTSVFPQSKVESVLRYEEGESPDKAGTIKHAGFTLANQQFSAMDSAHNHEFTFNEAVSFIIDCEDQKEIDFYWEKLSAVPEAEQCGWIKDKFGLSWQIVPHSMEQMYKEKNQEKLDRVTQAFLKMKKFDIAELQKAYDGNE